MRIFFLSLLLLPLFTFANKVDKKGTLLNKKCRGFGTNCNASVETQATYILDEPGYQGLWIQIEENEARKNQELYKLLKNKSNIMLEEDMIIPSDVQRRLKLKIGHTVPAGKYTLKFMNNMYYIQLQR